MQAFGLTAEAWKLVSDFGVANNLHTWRRLHSLTYTDRRKEAHPHKVAFGDQVRCLVNGEKLTWLSSERASQKMVRAVPRDIITRCGDYSSKFRRVPVCFRRRKAIPGWRQRSADPVDVLNRCGHYAKIQRLPVRSCEPMLPVGVSSLASQARVSSRPLLEKETHV